MTSVITLVGRSISRVRGVLVGVAALLIGVQIVIVLVAADQQRAQSFDLIMRIAPSFVQRQLGPSMPLLLSFRGLVTFGYFHPVVMLTLAVAAALVASELAGDVESGYVDLLLSRPVARRWLVTRSLVLVVLVPVGLVAAMLCATWGALALFAREAGGWPSFPLLWSMAVRLCAVAWCFGAAALAFAAVARRRAGALGPAAILAISMYLLELLAGSWRPLRAPALLAPFHYYQAMAVLAGSASLWHDVGVLLSMIVPLVAFAYWRFGARDV